MSSSISLEYLNNRIGPGNIGFTNEGGMFIYLINNTGSNSIKGSVVKTSPNINDAFILAPANSDQPIGIVYDDNIPNGSLCKVIVSGKTYALLKNGESSTRGYWCGVSDVPGRMYQQSDPPSTTEHSREIGHSLETKPGGTNVLSLVVLHFN